MSPYCESQSMENDFDQSRQCPLWFWTMKRLQPFLFMFKLSVAFSVTGKLKHVSSLHKQGSYRILDLIQILSVIPSKQRGFDVRFAVWGGPQPRVSRGRGHQAGGDPGPRRHLQQRPREADGDWGVLCVAQRGPASVRLQGHYNIISSSLSREDSHHHDIQGLTLCDGDKVSVDSVEIRTIPAWPSVASCRSDSELWSYLIRRQLQVWEGPCKEQFRRTRIHCGQEKWQVCDKQRSSEVRCYWYFLS